MARLVAAITSFRETSEALLGQLPDALDEEIQRAIEPGGYLEDEVARAIYWPTEEEDETSTGRGYYQELLSPDQGALLKRIMHSARRSLEYAFFGDARTPELPDRENYRPDGATTGKAKR